MCSDCCSLMDDIDSAEDLETYESLTDTTFSPVTVWQGRDYQMFAVLAGVRGLLAPIAERRGIPTDISKRLQWLNEHLEALGDHSFSFLLIDEIDPITKFRIF